MRLPFISYFASGRSARSLLLRNLKASSNQFSRNGKNVHVTAQDLLQVPEGEITEAGLRWNVDVGLRYLQSWLGGSGCVPIYNLMEDAATAELCRAQVWQWVRHGAKFDDGRPVTDELVRRIVAEQRRDLPGERVDLAAQILEGMMTSADFPEFLTVAAYDLLE